VIEFKKKSEDIEKELKDMQIGLENMKVFYHYLQYSYLNALKERILNTTFADPKNPHPLKELDVSMEVKKL